MADLTLCAEGNYINPVIFAATEGTTYHFAVAGESCDGWAIGDIVLSWGKTSPATFTSPETATFTVGTPGSFSISSAGFPAAWVGRITGAVPPGLTDHCGWGTATLEGTPAAGSGGTYVMLYEAHNHVEPTGYQSLTVVVNEAPAITSPNATTFDVGESGSFTVTATGYPVPAVTHCAGDLPSGVVFDSSTATLSGTPAPGTAGSYPLTFAAANGVTPDATQSFVLNVSGDCAPGITAHPENTSVVIGETATFEVEFSARPAATIQWQVCTNGGRKWTDISGADTASYTTPATKRNMDGYRYRVVLTNALGSQTSNEALLTVTAETFTTADVRIDTMCFYDPATSIVEWTLIVTNDGPELATGVKVTDTLGKGIKLSSIDLTDIAGAPYKVRGSKVDVNIGDLNAGEDVFFTIRAVVTARATWPLKNVASVSTTSYDPDLTNNTDTATAD